MNLKKKEIYLHHPLAAMNLWIIEYSLDFEITFITKKLFITKSAKNQIFSIWMDNINKCGICAVQSGFDMLWLE